MGNKNNQQQNTPNFNNMTDQTGSIWLNSKFRDKRDKRSAK